jgi:hypothetical protein
MITRKSRRQRSLSLLRTNHKEGLGFSIELRAFPMDGRLVVLPPDGDDNRK